MIDFSNQDLIYSILNGIPDGIVIYDLDLNVQYFNNAAARMLGKAPEALENMTAKDLMFDKEDNKLFQSILSDDSEKISFRRIYMTGPGYYEEAHYPIHNESKNVAGMLSKIIDRPQHQSDPAEKEKSMLKALMENIPARIYFKDVKGKFVLCSRSKSAFHGFEHPEEILNLSDFDLYSEKHAFKAYTDEKNIMKSGEPMVDTEEITEMANGDHLWCTTTKMPLYDSNHEVIGTFGISKDITEQKKLERELKFKNGRLQKLVDHLFYDLKVPIRGLKSIGESILMESRKSLSSQSRKDFEMFLNRADQILGYIDDAAKELSRNEAHTSEIS